MDKQALKKLQESLPHGAMTQIGKELGLEYNQVWRVLTGRTENLKVLELALNYIEAQKTKSSELNERLKTLVA